MKQDIFPMAVKIMKIFASTPPDKILSYKQLYDTLYHDKDFKPIFKVLHVHMGHMRKALPKGIKIVAVPGHGFVIDCESQDRLKRFLQLRAARNAKQNMQQLNA